MPINFSPQQGQVLLTTLGHGRKMLLEQEYWLNY